jgi:diguanylate cyclase (GGDEF)-like protein
MGSVGSVAKEGGWQDLCAEAEEMLKPTLQLAAQMAAAYDQIRQQSNNLMTFTEVRTDPLTGVSNRRALDDTLESQLAMLHRYEQSFSVLIIDIDHFKQINDEQGHLYGDRMLKTVAKLLAETVRETDMVARYGGEEFVIVMPQTPLEGAIIFSDRLRQRIEQDLPLTVSGGVTMTMEGDDSQTLLARADAALYGAKAAGRNRLFCHTGQAIEAATVVQEEGAPPLTASVPINGEQHARAL